MVTVEADMCAMLAMVLLVTIAAETTCRELMFACQHLIDEGRARCDGFGDLLA